MLLPIGDTPNPRGKPYVTYCLMAVNIAVFLFVSLPLIVQPPDFSNPLLLDYLRAIGARGRISADQVMQHVTAYDLFVFQFGYRPASPSTFTAFTAMFLHGSWMHLAGNMLFLWIFGDNVEARLGRLGYLLVYLGTGIAATLFFAIFVPGSAVPMIGASGAISGVLGCYFLWFPRNQVKILFFPFIFISFLIPARIVLGVYLLIENLLPFLVNGGSAGGVAHGAHIGGFLAGMAVAGLVQKRSGRGAARRGGAGPEVVAAGRVTRSLQRGNVSQAVLHFLSLPEPEQRQVPTGDLLTMGDFLLDRLDNHGALTFYRRIIAERPNDPLLDRACLGAGKALYRQPRQRTSAYQHFLSAVDVTKNESLVEEARQYLRAIEKGQ
ncbi:MAG: rhomboid family intramembrane serine protease [Desulfuromonadales bacterium]